MTVLAARLGGLIDGEADGDVDRKGPLRVIDIGCGTGASIAALAGVLPPDTLFVGVDLFQPFLDVLEERVAEFGDRVTTVCASMEDLPFDDASFDVVWSEGAIYNMGFSKGIAAFSRLLKPGGILAVSEIVWLLPEPRLPEELAAFWNAEYPEIARPAPKISALEDAGYSLKGFFVLGVECWMDGYYRPLQESFDAFLAAHPDDDDAAALIASERSEVSQYQSNSHAYSYGFFICQWSH